MPYKKIITHFTNSIDALKEFIELEKIFERRFQKILKNDPVSLLPQILLKTEALIDAGEFKGEELKEIKKRKAILQKICKKFFEYKIDKKGKIVRIAPKSNQIHKKYVETMTQLSIKIIGGEFVVRSTLMNLISIFEKLFTDIIFHIAEVNPSSLELDKESISFGEINKIKNIKEIKQIILSKIIDDQLRESKDNWFKYIENCTGTKMDFIDKYQKRLTEISERRNIFVHNVGIVNKNYLSNVSKELINKFKAIRGKKLKTDSKYLIESIELIEAIGIFMIAKIWKQFEKKDTSRADFLNTYVVYPRLQKKVNFVAKHIAEFIMNDSCAEALSHDYAQLNYWLAIKQDGRFNEIKNDIFTVDYTSKAKILQLGLFALQNNKSKFFKLLKELLKSKEIDLKEYEEFPIFADMRKTKESKALYSNKKGKKKK